MSKGCTSSRRWVSLVQLGADGTVIQAKSAAVTIVNGTSGGRQRQHASASAIVGAGVHTLRWQFTLQDARTYYMDNAFLARTSFAANQRNI